MHVSLEDIREIFHKRDLRCTRQRELVYSALAATKSHPTAEELFDSVHTLDGAISLATVYNTLEILQEAGLCRRLPSASGPARFDADMTDHVHITTPKGEVIDLPDDLSRRLLDSLPSGVIADLERRTGMSLVGMSLHVGPGRDAAR